MKLCIPYEWDSNDPSFILFIYDMYWCIGSNLLRLVNNITTLVNILIIQQFIVYCFFHTQKVNILKEASLNSPWMVHWLNLINKVSCTVEKWNIYIKSFLCFFYDNFNLKVIHFSMTLTVQKKICAFLEKKV